MCWKNGLYFSKPECTVELPVDLQGHGFAGPSDSWQSLPSISGGRDLRVRENGRVCRWRETVATWQSLLTRLDLSSCSKLTKQKKQRFYCFICGVSYFYIGFCVLQTFCELPWVESEVP